MYVRHTCIYIPVRLAHVCQTNPCNSYKAHRRTKLQGMAKSALRLVARPRTSQNRSGKCRFGGLRHESSLEGSSDGSLRVYKRAVYVSTSPSGFKETLQAKLQFERGDILLVYNRYFCLLSALGGEIQKPLSLSTLADPGQGPPPGTVWPRMPHSGLGFRV